MSKYNLGKITVKNFRVFSEFSTFSIKPITLLTGTNNSGKTSLLKAMTLLKHGSYSKFERLEFGGENLELGSFESCKTHDTEKDKLSFGLEFDYVATVYPNNIKLFSDYVLLYLDYKKQVEDGKLVNLNIIGINKLSNYIEHLIIITIPDNLKEGNPNVFINVKHFLDTIKETVNRFEKVYPKKQSIELGKIPIFKAENVSLLIDYDKPKVDDTEFPKKFLSLNTNIIDSDSLRKILGGISDDDLNNIYYILNEFILNYLSVLDLTQEYWDSNLYTLNLERGNLTTSELIWIFIEPYILSESQVGVIGNIDFSRKITYLSRNTGKIKQLTFDNLEKYLPHIKKVSDTLIKDILIDEFYDFYSNYLMDYLFNKYKEITVPLPINYLDVFKSGKQRLYLDANKQTALSRSLSKLSHFELSMSKRKFITKWINRFDIGDKLILERVSGTATKVLIKKNKRNIELSDLGYGISQLVSILLTVVINCEEKNADIIFMLEEPETNLHPKLQSLLADFFLDATLQFKVKFIIETHSEYLIRKLQYLTAKKKIKPDASIIYYFHHPDNIPNGEEQVKEIKINEDGSLTDDFGPGFFDEATNIKFNLLKIKNTQNN